MAAGDSNDATPHKRCLDCGYILYGLPENRCPECGREFDPDDPMTFRVRSARWPWWFWAKPPRWWHLLPVAVFGTWFIHLASEPSQFPGGYPISSLGLIVIPLCCLEYTLRLAFVIAARRRMAGRNGNRKLKQRWRWCVTPLVIALLFSGDWPMRLRFAMSRPPFERAAQAALVGNPPARPGWVGLYHVKSIYTAPEGIVYFETGYGFADYVGFVYRPQGATTPGRRHLAPSWYVECW